MPEDEAWNSSHKLRQEHQGQKHGVLTEHTHTHMWAPKRPIWGGVLTTSSLTSLSIHGLPRHVAKQPNRPKITMMAPVPMRTYGALVPPSEARDRYASRLTLPHTPTASSTTPVNWKPEQLSRKRADASLTDQQLFHLSNMSQRKASQAQIKKRKK